MNEYINKKTIIDALEEENKRQPFQPTSIYSCVIPFIRQLPATEVQPVKRGKWILKENAILISDECSLCKCSVSILEAKFYKFCPYCGARMDGDSE